jgi:hypothetical protein
MTAENFCYWLQGFLEISKTDQITKEQVEEIKNHLALIFTKVTPDLSTHTVTCPPIEWNPPVYQTPTVASRLCSSTPSFNTNYLSHAASC